MMTVAITGTAWRVHGRLHHGIDRHRAGDVVVAAVRLSKRVATGFSGALKTDVESRTPAARTQ
jgi:hypothetical protein